MTNVTIVSAFRNSDVLSYRERIEALRIPVTQLRLVCVEGDSTDDTLGHLQAWAFERRDMVIVKRDLGKPHYGSIVHPERFEILATVFNAGLNAVDLTWTDYVMFLPSDIVYSPDLVGRLLAHDKDLIAPFMWMNGRFYDIWGFVELNGRNFDPFAPEDVPYLYGTKPFQMSMVGGVILMSADVVRKGCRYSTVDVDHGLCRDALAHGFTVWADPSTHVYHPVH